ncbi:uncharacterized protein LOC135172687 [Diachasmimorpha longicaudata]|uniref:uncharacterized protein LOC135172687 n=1 Tax=Diachasmimorpha longicaudata TaxID=58733 RepID=UPI0030B8AF21
MLLLRFMLIVPLAHVELFLMPSLTDLWNLAKLGWKIGTKIKEGYDTYEKLMEDPTDDTNEKIDKVMSHVVEISGKIEGFESRLDQRLDSIVESLVNRITLVQKLDTSFLELHKTIVAIDNMWENYLKYSKNRRNFNRETIIDFISWSTGPQHGGLQALLSQMHRLVVPLRTANLRESLLMTMLKHELEVQLISCDEGVSHQSVIFQIYYTVALTELRGFTMTAYSYGLKPVYKKGKYIAEVDEMRARFTMRTRDYLLATKEAMQVASKRIRRCDPKGGFKRGQSFAEMEELFQTYVVNEADIHHGNSCKKTCETMKKTTFLRATDKASKYDYSRPCRGDIIGCRFGGGKMTLCTGEFPRRYEWFKESNGAVKGDNSNGCPNKLYYPSGWKRGFYKCDYCVCTCEANRANSKAKRAISFRNVQVNIHQNMAVTGVRIVQHDGMIHLQLQEGRIEAGGMIQKNSQRWLPIEKLRYEAAGDAGRYWIDYTRVRKDLMKVGVDFDFITGSSRSINLDDVEAPKGHVVVGARFNRPKGEKDDSDNPIRLEILYKRVDYVNGKLSHSNSDNPQWMGVDSKQSSRTRVKFDAPDNPLKHNLNLPTLKPNLYIEFRESDTKKDAGQSTIPFWDIQEVVTTPAFPLSGIGIFHKGHRDGLYGGYLALRLLSFDFAHNLNTTMPDDIQKAYKEIYAEPVYTPTGVL